ncbi:MAG: phosphatidylinositol-specific phospholipase C1-like protein [Sandaracinaceae bacterium]|nr:phosphatidylinositol-specific phospholipase C1-like protein [Sandaracinaceae bacterium]
MAHPLDDVLRLHHLQAEGTHNSYHLRPSEETIPDWDYDMAPLGTQLGEQGVRKVELDLHWDPDIQRYRVLHLPLLDERTTCDLFLDCLVALRRWSDANPGHHPLFVMIEPKTPGTGSLVLERMDAMEAEILAVFPEELLITPDLVRGDAATLDEAVTTRGWPTLGEVRGRTMFFLNCDREWCVTYADVGAGLEGRLVFADSEPGDRWSAVRIMNRPGPDVRAAVEAGYFVRTRAVSIVDALSSDGPTLEADLAAALDTGAHVISCDVPAPRPDVPFFVEMPGGTPSRCNPVTAPAECTSAAIEDPARLAL